MKCCCCVLDRETTRGNFQLIILYYVVGKCPRNQTADDHEVPAVFWSVWWTEQFWFWCGRPSDGSVLCSVLYCLMTGFTFCGWTFPLISGCDVKRVLYWTFHSEHDLHSVYIFIFTKTHICSFLWFLRDQKHPEIKNARCSNVNQFHHVCKLSQLMMSSRGPDPGLDLDFLNSHVFIVLNVQTH